MPLVFAPETSSLVLWGGDDATLGRLAHTKTELEVVASSGAREKVRGRALTLDVALPALATIGRDTLGAAPSIAAWSLATKLALDLVARERFAPRLKGDEARWAAALAQSEDAERVARLARAMPPAAHALATGKGKTEVWAAEAMLRAFLDAAVDRIVRDAAPPADRSSNAWETRFEQALRSKDAPTFSASGFAERTVEDELARFSDPALGARDRPRTFFRLELPEEGEAFAVRFLLQSPEDPSLIVSAADVWQGRGTKLSALRDPGEALLAGVAFGARVFPPLGAALAEKLPAFVTLDPDTAWSFLREGAPALAAAGFGVHVPAELTARGQRRLRLRLRLEGATPRKVAGTVAGASALSFDELVKVQWEAAIGDEKITQKELAALAKQKAPLVRFRGAWVAVDPEELREIEKRLAKGEGRMSAGEAIRIALEGETTANGLPAEVEATGAFAEALAVLRSGTTPASEAPPEGLRATLRPYQRRGLAWLRTMRLLGLGACLADDMGLGKTIQLLAFVLGLGPGTPVLVVAPTSVLGNWEREIERFTPDITVVRHFGSRAKTSRALEESAHAHASAIVLTSYGVLRRDAKLLAEIDWRAVVFDEAQNVKNAASTGARAARALVAAQKIALTGTPVENRLAELWSILELTNPGMLGPLTRFKTEIAVPVEKWGNREVAERLRKITAPFVLRRTKSDRAIIDDLPPKNEMRVACTLTREQASLYRAVVDEEMRRIANAEGAARRGRVLALLTALKQICNHPAHYLGEKGPLRARSGKLARLTEMLEEALSADDRSLVFTQFREMGARLVAHLEGELGEKVLFLHGGTTKRARDEMVRRFQEEERGPRVFVLSLKAGGTGLNLTAATHVFHYDRWWNPAVEDQATDRAYRIGQKRSVQVHKLFCAGTVEAQVDALLERKRDLAARVVGEGESWITELSDAELRALVTLGKDAVTIVDEVAE